MKPSTLTGVQSLPPWSFLSKSWSIARLCPNSWTKVYRNKIVCISSRSCSQKNLASLRVLTTAVTGFDVLYSVRLVLYDWDEVHTTPTYAIPIVPNGCPVGSATKNAHNSAPKNTPTFKPLMSLLKRQLSFEHWSQYLEVWPPRKGEVPCHCCYECCWHLYRLHGRD